MQWTLESKMNKSNFWILQHNEKSKAQLRYNREARSIRLQAGERRLYFLEQVWHANNKIELQTEYSIVIGEIQMNRERLSGNVIMDGQHYTFTTEKDQVHLQENTRTIKTVIIEDTSGLDFFEFSALLFGFCSSLINTRLKQEYEIA